MFREMRRKNRQITDEECAELLGRLPRGVMALHGEDGYPYAFPLNFIYSDGKLYFHCAKQGHKLDAIAKDCRASFCVYDEGYRRPGEWALNIKSVIVFGKVSKVESPDKTEEIITKLAMKYYPSEEEAINAVKKAIARVQILEMTVDHMTGKLVNES